MYVNQSGTYVQYGCIPERTQEHAWSLCNHSALCLISDHTHQKIITNSIDDFSHAVSI